MGSQRGLPKTLPYSLDDSGSPESLGHSKSTSNTFLLFPGLMDSIFPPLDLTRAFVIYFNGSVVYDGRARSVLDNCNLLLIKKNDGCVLIHGGAAIPARNYMGAGSKLSLDGTTLICVRKNEKIQICFNEIIQWWQLYDWSESEIEISRTERELVLKLFMDWPDYFNITCYSIEMEAETTYGKVDLLGTGFDGMKHVIEVKRRKASIPNVTQLKRYVDCFDRAIGYLAAPDIGEKALKYLGECGYNYIKVKF